MDKWGLFCFEQKFFNFLTNKNVMLEREPIQKLIKKKNLMAFKHNGFWMCMDTSRDKQV